MKKALPVAESAIPTRRSLVARLKQRDDRESWQESFETYWKLIYAVAVRSGLNEVYLVKHRLSAFPAEHVKKLRGML